MVRGAARPLLALLALGVFGPGASARAESWPLNCDTTWSLRCEHAPGRAPTSLTLTVGDQSPRAKAVKAVRMAGQSGVWHVDFDGPSALYAGHPDGPAWVFFFDGGAGYVARGACSEGVVAGGSAAAPPTMVVDPGPLTPEGLPRSLVDVCSQDSKRPARCRGATALREGRAGLTNQAAYQALDKGCGRGLQWACAHLAEAVSDGARATVLAEAASKAGEPYGCLVLGWREERSGSPSRDLEAFGAAQRRAAGAFRATCDKGLPAACLALASGIRSGATTPWPRLSASRSRRSATPVTRLAVCASRRPGATGPGTSWRGCVPRARARRVLGSRTATALARGA